MRSSSRSLLCAVCGVFALILPGLNFAQTQEVQPAAVAYAAVSEFPDSPGAVRAQEQGSANPQNSPAAQQTGSAAAPQANTPAKPPADAQAQADQKLQRPVGTAAAEAPKVSGITAAQPAGIAIAPAKQHRVRTIAIKVGAILGAGAAIGTVIALTEATPSKPPGAH